MGKASSMESLRKDLQRIDEEGGMVKAKTKSTSDIFRFAGNLFIIRGINRNFFSDLTRQWLSLDVLQ